MKKRPPAKKNLSPRTAQSSRLLTKKSFFVLLLILIFCLGWWVFKKTLIIKTVDCNYNQNPCPEKVTQAISPLTGQSILFYDLDQNLQPIGEHTYSKVLPNQIKIEFKKLNPEYSAPDKFSFTQTKQTTSPEENEQLNDLFVNIEKYKIESQGVEILDQVFIIILNEKVRAVIDKKQTESGIYKLSQILAKLNLNAIDLDIVEIDTRFKMPVLRTEQTQFPAAKIN